MSNSRLSTLVFDDAKKKVHNASLETLQPVIGRLEETYKEKPKATATLINILLEHPSYKVVCALAKSKTLSHFPEAQMNLATHERLKHKSFLAALPGLTDDVQVHLSRLGFPEAAPSTNSKSNTLALENNNEIVLETGKNSSKTANFNTASHDHNNGYKFEMLPLITQEDKNRRTNAQYIKATKIALAQNPYANSKEAQLNLATNPDEDIQLVLAGRKIPIDEDAQIELSKSPFPSVQALIAGNINLTSQQAQLNLSKSDRQDITAPLAGNISLTNEDAQHNLSKSPWAKTRIALVNNDSLTDPDAQNNLAIDSDESVRSAVINRTKPYKSGHYLGHLHGFAKNYQEYKLKDTLSDLNI